MKETDDEQTTLRLVTEAQQTLQNSGTEERIPEQRTLVRPGKEAAEMQPEAQATLQHSGTLVRTPEGGTLVRPGNESAETQSEAPTTVSDGSATVLRTVNTSRTQRDQDTAAAPTLKVTAPGTFRDALDVPQPAHQGPLEPGSVIKDRFVLESVLGKGGMGLVFSAVDRRKLEARDPNPHVALKVLSADFAWHPQSFMALQREARKAQTLAHPNVVTVFDFDRDGDTVYMTMELLKGRSLDAIVREGRGKGNSSELALPIIRGIADGLAYAHRKGIVHSDLKPGNVFIAEDGTPKILDFGIARAVPSSVSEENQDEFDAGSLGAYTEAYATDEMVAGVDPHPADDMYALGLIAYELITGFHPYQRHSAPNARKLGIKPAPLKGLKRKQARTIERCLSFERKDRPQNADEFLKAFRGVTRLQKVTLAASAVLALTAGYLWYQNYVETGPAIPFGELPAEVQQDFREAMQVGNEAWVFYERDGFTDAINGALAKYAEAYDLHPRNREAVAALNRAADAALKAAGNDAELRREIARQLQDRSAHYRKYAPVVDAAK